MKSKSLIIILFVVCLLLTSCYVCDKIYLPINEQDKTKTHFNVGLINISCHIPPAEPSNLIITIWFDESLKSEPIDNLILDVSPIDGNNFQLKSVDVTCLENKINPLKDKVYIQKEFKALPAGARMTNINNAKIYYTFDLLSERPIKSKNIDLKYLISFSERTPIDDNINLKRVKTCSFRIH